MIVSKMQERCISITLQLLYSYSKSLKSTMSSNSYSSCDHRVPFKTK